jgi:hypothetical protein
VAVAKAEAVRFTQRMQVYEASPSAYKERLYLTTLAEAIAPVKKYLLAATNTSDVVVLDLQDKLRTDIGSGLVLPPDATAAGATNK